MTESEPGGASVAHRRLAGASPVEMAVRVGGVVIVTFIIPQILFLLRYDHALGGGANAAFAGSSRAEEKSRAALAMDPSALYTDAEEAVAAQDPGGRGLLLAHGGSNNPLRIASDPVAAKYTCLTLNDSSPSSSLASLIPAEWQHPGIPRRREAQIRTYLSEKETSGAQVMVSAEKLWQSRDARQRRYLKQYLDKGVVLHSRVHAACSKLDAMRAVVMITGPPGAGKSALAAMAIYYGHYGKDTEGTRGASACKAKVDHCVAKAAQLQEDEPVRCEKKDVCNDAYVRQNVFPPLLHLVDGLLLVGGGGLHQPQGQDACRGDESRFGKKLTKLLPEEVIRVLILPSNYCEGPECKIPGGGDRVHHDAEKRQAAFSAMSSSGCQDLYDVVITNDGCEASGLYEVCTGAYLWLRTPINGSGSAAGGDQEERRRRVERFYDERRAAAG